VIAGGEGKINLSNIPSNAKIEYNGHVSMIVIYQ